MKLLRRTAPTLAVLLGLYLPAAPGWAARPVAAAAPLPPVAGEVIVKFRTDAATLRQHRLAAGTDPARLQAVLASRAASLGARHGRMLQAGALLGEDVQVVRVAGADAQALAQQLGADPEVEYAVPNGRQRRLAAPNDPLYAASATATRSNGIGTQAGPASGQWYLRAPDATIRSAIGIEAAWERSRGAADVVVAVLDSGVRFEHPDLGRAANGGVLLPGYDMVSNAQVANDGDGRDGDPSDPGDHITLADTGNSTFFGCGFSPSSWHGTHTASLVGALTDNGIGMAGAAPGIQVLPVRVLGKCFGDDADIIAGMRWAAGLLAVDGVVNPHPARVLNLSLGSPGACNAAYQAAVDELVAAGVTVVAAAGNSTGGPVGTPANCNGVVAVLALRHVGTKVGFSDLGSQITIAAPGGNCVNIRIDEPCLYPILAATDSGSQGPMQSAWTDSFNPSVGTSFASPLVAGVAALMISARPGLKPAEVRAALQATARPFPGSGADNGPDDPTPVQACRAPSSFVEQLQCYCSTSLCGAGMLDAGAAVAAVAGPLARIGLLTPNPRAGAAVSLSAADSLAPTGRTLVAYEWVLLDGGGIVGAFSSATNAETATLTPGAAGSFSVRLTVTDSGGASHTSTSQVVVQATVEPPTPPTAGDGGGGGASSLPWVLGLALAGVGLRLNAARRRA